MAAPEEFVGLAGSARAELDLHAEGLASLEEAVASLCERGVEERKAARSDLTSTSIYFFLKISFLLITHFHYCLLLIFIVIITIFVFFVVRDDMD